MGARSQRYLRSSVLMVGFLAVAAMPAFAQTPRYQRYEQKLAPFVPSPQRAVDRMLEMAAPKASETVYDLGCGDGRVLITAVQKFNSRAVGIELDERLVQRATDRIARMSLQNQI